MPRCIIVCAGEYGEVNFTPLQDDYVIACDGGYDSALRRGLEVNLLMGDFDSYHGAIPADLPVKRFPVDKDDTDSMLAVKEGIDRGYGAFVLLFALGGSLSHTLANIQTLAYITEHQCVGEVVGPREKLYMIKNSVRKWPGETVGKISVFAYGGNIERVTLAGLKYPLDGPLTTSFPLGVSNQFTGRSASVTASGGSALIVLSR